MTIEAREAPTLPGGLPLLGHLVEARRDPLEILRRGAAAGPVCRFQFGPFAYFLVNEPDAIRHVLVERAAAYTKSRNYRGVKLVVGEGLLTSEGELWRRQRKLAQPAFHRERLGGFAETTARMTREMIDRWATEGEATRDVHAEMMALTLRVVGLALLSVDLEKDARAIGAALTVALAYANDYAESLFPVPPWVPTPRNARFRRALATLDETVGRTIRERRASSERHDDLLGMLMEARDEETGEGIGDRQLRDEVMTMVLAGHETTANALAFTFYLLSRHPEVARRLATHVQEALGDREPTLADLPRLGYAKQVIEESMRLFPPAWAFERQAQEDDRVAGCRVPRGAIVGISPYQLHRLPEHWANPEGFDPERFSPDRAATRPRYTYLPFGGGPRVCIGSSFAMMEATIVLAMVVRAFHLELLPGARLALEPSITLRPRGGLPMRVRPASAGVLEQLGAQGGEVRRRPHGVRGRAGEAEAALGERG